MNGNGQDGQGGQQQDQEFFEMADAFINLANEYGDKGAIGKVSAALLFAAARYNAFYVAAVEDISLENERDVAMEYFTRQYQSMLNDNLDDYKNNPPLPGKAG